MSAMPLLWSVLTELQRGDQKSDAALWIQILPSPPHQKSLSVGIQIKISPLYNTNITNSLIYWLTCFRPHLVGFFELPQQQVILDVWQFEHFFRLLVWQLWNKVQLLLEAPLMSWCLPIPDLTRRSFFSKPVARAGLDLSCVDEHLAWR